MSDLSVLLMVEVVARVRQYRLLATVGRLRVLRFVDVEVAEFKPRLYVGRELLEVGVQRADSLRTFTHRLQYRHLAFQHQLNTAGRGVQVYDDDDNVIVGLILYTRYLQLYCYTCRLNRVLYLYRETVSSNCIDFNHSDFYYYYFH